MIELLMNHPSEGICTNSHKWRRNGSNNAWGSLTYSIRPALPLRCLYLGVHSTCWNQSICETPMSSRILTYARRGPKFRILGWTSNTSCKTVSSIPWFVGYIIISPLHPQSLQSRLHKNCWFHRWFDPMFFGYTKLYHRYIPNSQTNSPFFHIARMVYWF